MDLHGSILFCDAIHPSIRALTLAEGNAMPNLLQAVWSQFSTKIEAFCKILVNESRAGDHHEQFHERPLKRHLLSLVVAGGTPSVLSTLGTRFLRLNWL